MKRKTMFWILSLCLMSAVSVNAQVTIGGLTDPAPGAILDLNSPGGARGGLVPASIKIDDVSVIPASQLRGIIAAQDTKLDLRGMVVYNTGTANVPPGIYVWNGYSWTRDGKCIPIVTVNSKRVGIGNNEHEATMGVKVEGYPPFEIKWYKIDDPTTVLHIDSYQPEELSNPVTPMLYPTSFKATGLSGSGDDIEFYCTVKSNYSDVLVYSDTIRVRVCTSLAIELDSIRGSASGCVNSTQTYWVPRKEGVTYIWDYPTTVLDKTGGGGPDDSFLMVQVKSPISITDTIKVTSSNDCGAESTTQTLALLPGYTITDGVYDATTDTLTIVDAGYNQSGTPRNGISLENLTGLGFTQTSTDLCLANKDPLNPQHPATSPFLYGFSRVEAVSYCDSLGSGWRLPNIAELGQIQSNMPETDYGLNTSYVGSRFYPQNTLMTIYWSTTVETPRTVVSNQEFGTNWAWNFNPSEGQASAQTTDLVSGKTAHTNEVGKYLPIRCVQSIQ